MSCQGDTPLVVTDDEVIEYYERVFAWVIGAYPETEGLFEAYLGPGELERIKIEEQERQPS